MIHTCARKILQMALHQFSDGKSGTEVDTSFARQASCYDISVGLRRWPLAFVGLNFDGPSLLSAFNADDKMDAIMYQWLIHEKCINSLVANIISLRSNLQFCDLQQTSHSHSDPPQPPHALEHPLPARRKCRPAIGLKFSMHD
jgi:hypothetical protein